MFNPRRWIDIILAILAAVSLALMALGNEDPFVRDAVCKGLGFCPKSSHAAAWNRLFYDVGLGSLISLVFYWLLIRLPDIERRRRIRKSLRLHYQFFQEDCISLFLGITDGSYNLDRVDELLDKKAFKEYFNQKVSSSEEKWHVFLNNLEDHHLRELVRHMEVFRDEVLFVLNNTDITDREAFEFFKRLSRAIYLLKDTTLDYDETKPLSGFLWSLFAGWDWTTGYQKEDIVKKMIRSI